MNRLIVFGILLPYTMGACWWGRPQKQEVIDKKKRASVTVVRMIREDSRMFPVDDMPMPVKGGRHPGYKLGRQLSTVGMQDVDLRARGHQSIDGLGTAEQGRSSDRTWWSWICCCCMGR